MRTGSSPRSSMISTTWPVHFRKLTSCSTTLGPRLPPSATRPPEPAPTTAKRPRSSPLGNAPCCASPQIAPMLLSRWEEAECLCWVTASTREKGRPPRRKLLRCYRCNDSSCRHCAAIAATIANTCINAAAASADFERCHRGRTCGPLRRLVLIAVCSKVTSQ